MVLEHSYQPINWRLLMAKIKQQTKSKTQNGEAQQADPISKVNCEAEQFFLSVFYAAVIPLASDYAKKIQDEANKSIVEVNSKNQELLNNQEQLEGELSRQDSRLKSLSEDLKAAQKKLKKLSKSSKSKASKKKTLKK